MGREGSLTLMLRQGFPLALVVTYSKLFQIYQSIFFFFLIEALREIFMSAVFHFERDVWRFEKTYQFCET